MYEDAKRSLSVTAHRDKGPATDTAAEVKASLFDRDRWLLLDRNSALNRVVLPIPTSIDKVELAEHVKLEG